MRTNVQIFVILTWSIDMMKNGMENGKPKMENGKPKMENGWKMKI